MAKMLYEKRNRIAYITLNRPEALNALDDELNDELWAAWQDFAADDELDVGILTGVGKAFCTGADLKTFIPKWETASMLDVRRNVPTGIGGGITRGQHQITKPIIAAINGYAIGGGFELALACDLRIASDNAIFGAFGVRYGLHQGDGGLVRLVAIAGLATALELTLTGREVTAGEAYRMRLVTKVVAHDDLMSTAEKYASLIMRNSQRAVQSAKETILDVIGRSLDDALRLESINAYSNLKDFSEARDRMAQSYSNGKHPQMV
jgi:enoyl-CoA hydratase/carnithine racemase